MAERNQAFYEQFVTEYGTNPAHTNLWTGEQIQSLIYSLLEFQTSNSSRDIIAKCNANLAYYKSLYKKLTTANFIQ